MSSVSVTLGIWNEWQWLMRVTSQGSQPIAAFWTVPRCFHKERSPQCHGESSAQNEKGEAPGPRCWPLCLPSSARKALSRAQPRTHATAGQTASWVCLESRESPRCPRGCDHTCLGSPPHHTWCPQLGEVQRELKIMSPTEGICFCGGWLFLRAIETGPRCVAQASLEATQLLPPLQEC